MISLVLRQTTELLEEAGSYHYRVAGISISSDTPVEYLRSFKSLPEVRRQTPSVTVPKSDGKRITVYMGTGWISQAWRDVHCEIGRQGYYVTISGIGCFFVLSSGRQIELVQKESGCAPDLVEEALLGPPLILALAKHSIWCIHASAVVAANHALLFTGRSGAGKSTIAGYLDNDQRNAFLRFADDLVPISLKNGAIVAHTRYPQLKLGVNSQPHIRKPEHLPIAAIHDLCNLEHDEVRIERVSGQAAAMMLAQHTISSRLFDAKLLESHLDFCAVAAQSLRVSRLCYPRNFAAMNTLGHFISVDLSMLQVEHN